ncbi:hypothetical protein PO124_16745 [Bacillus licheniformis]|nr:hypothetical protein [Bacillus licheniformis]
MIGIGDHMLHFSTQTWVTTLSSEKTRPQYLFVRPFVWFGICSRAFLTPLVNIAPSLPFIVSGAFSLLAWLFIFACKRFP